MKENQSISSLLKRLWHHISPHRRGQFGLLLVLMFLASFAEILSIGAVLPFLGVLTAPERIFDMSIAQPFINEFNLTKPSQLLLPLTVAFGLAAILAGGMRILLLWASTRLSFAAGADLGSIIYRRTLYQPYSVHCERNSSEVIDGISGKANGVIYSVIVPCVSIVSSVLMLIAILVALLYVHPTVALAAFGGFALIYSFIVRLTRNKLLNNSLMAARQSSQVIKSLQEGLGGIRDVLIDGSQSTYCKIYSSADLPLRRAQGSSLFIGLSPRYAMESLGMVFIATLAYLLAMQGDGVANAIPVLGALAIGAQRLLPVLQQLYYAWSSMRGGQASLQDVVELLDQRIPDDAECLIEPLNFNKNITLKKISFSYSTATQSVIKNLSLTIEKGSRIGIIGTTGSGKSTLLDIVMGLLQPVEGSLEIDGQTVTSENARSWQKHISHVPQYIYLSDSSIEENIAFGVAKNEIDHDRVKKAAQQAQVAETIEALPEKYKTFVGERGIRLSGGQRQRIGIARALYKQADVIIFDEATSALDNETEEAVMDAINELSKNLTLLIIAHRLTTLKNCKKIVELENGSIKKISSYEDILS